MLAALPACAFVAVPPPALAAAQRALPDLAEAVPPPTKAFVAGATGQTGRRVVAQLRAAGVAVRAGARDEKKAQSLGFAAAGAEIVHADVTDGVDALVEAIGDADTVVRSVLHGTRHRTTRCVLRATHCA
jgi:putative NADH-flavin reductase